MNLKTEVTRKQNTANFPKNEHLPSDMHMNLCASGVRNVHFSEYLLCFVEIRPFSLLPTSLLL